MASLSLYVLNLLPVPMLDGMELVRCGVEWVGWRRGRGVRAEGRV